MQYAILLAALAASALAQDLTINTPTITGTQTPGAAECQPILLSWSGGTPPYIVDVDVSPTSGPHLADFQGLTNTSITWTVNAAVGTQLILSIKDNTGLSKPSAVFPVVTGSGDGCLSSGGGSTGGSSGSSDSSSPASTPSTGNSSPSSPSGTAPPPSSNSAKASQSGSTAAKPSSSTGAGVAVQAPAGVVPAIASVLLAGLVALLA